MIHTIAPVITVIREDTKELTITIHQMRVNITNAILAVMGAGIIILTIMTMDHVVAQVLIIEAVDVAVEVIEVVTKAAEVAVEEVVVVEGATPADLPGIDHWTTTAPVGMTARAMSEAVVEPVEVLA